MEISINIANIIFGIFLGFIGGFFGYIVCKKAEAIPDAPPTEPNEGHIALRSVKALAKKLGLTFGQYNCSDVTGVYFDDYNSVVATKGDFEILNHKLSLLIDYLNLEFVEKKETFIKKLKLK